MIQQLIQAPDRKQRGAMQTRILYRLLRAGYYQIPTYGKADQWVCLLEYVPKTGTQSTVACRFGLLVEVMPNRQNR